MSCWQHVRVTKKFEKSYLLFLTVKCPRRISDCRLSVFKMDRQEASVWLKWLDFHPRDILSFLVSRVHTKFSLPLSGSLQTFMFSWTAAKSSIQTAWVENELPWLVIRKSPTKYSEVVSLTLLILGLWVLSPYIHSLLSISITQLSSILFFLRQWNSASAGTPRKLCSRLHNC